MRHRRALALLLAAGMLCSGCSTGAISSNYRPVEDLALIQTIGRAARNSEGRVIMYADTITDSMKRAIDETNRRRTIQAAYNAEHGIVPKTIIKEVKSTLNITKKKSSDDDIKLKDIPEEIEKLKALMKVASAQLDFEKAIEIRDKIGELRAKMRRAERKGHA